MVRVERASRRLEGLHGQLSAAKRHRFQGPPGDDAVRQTLHRTRRQHPPRLRRVLQPLRDVDGVSHHRSPVSRHAPEIHLPAVQTAPDAQVPSTLARLRLRFPHHLQRRPHRAHRVVLVGDRGAPARHHDVPDEFVHAPAMALDHAAQARKEPVGRGAALGLRQVGEAGSLGEQDDDEAAFFHADILRTCRVQRFRRARRGPRRLRATNCDHNL
ncbi:MAG: hypothetical protein FD180_5179 [Planctomycetota bacterium]|nr:MAG: hypothetical protein FD180_5179 [Planctomycetota bacterium]